MSSLSDVDADDMTSAPLSGGKNLMPIEEDIVELELMSSPAGDTNARGQDRPYPFKAVHDVNVMMSTL